MYDLRTQLESSYELESMSGMLKSWWKDLEEFLLRVAREKDFWLWINLTWINKGSILSDWIMEPKVVGEVEPGEI